SVPALALPASAARQTSRHRSVGAPVDAVLEHVRGAEDQDAARADRNLLSGLRIATDAFSLAAYEEASEGRDLHVLAARQGVPDLLENRLDEPGRFVPRQTHLLIDGLAQLRSSHGSIGHRDAPGCFARKR